MTPEEAEAENLVNQWFLEDAKWELCQLLMPRRCWRSDRWMWFGQHWKLSRMYGGDVDAFPYVRWVHRDVGMEIKLMLL